MVGVGPVSRELDGAACAFGGDFGQAFPSYGVWLSSDVPAAHVQHIEDVEADRQPTSP